MLADFRLACRRLARAPGFTLAVVLSIAGGASLPAGALSLFEAVFARSLPGVRDAGRLVHIGPTSPLGLGQMPSHLLDVLRRDPRVDGACGFLPPGALVQYTDGLVRASTLALDGGCFRTLGVRPVLGRLFDEADVAVGGPKVAVISFDVWQRQYAGTANILGRAVRIDGVPFEIIGVTAPEFRGLVIGFPAEVMFPIQQGLATFPDGRGPFQWMSALLRLRPGRTLDALHAHVRSTAWRQTLVNTVPTSFNAVRREGYIQQPWQALPGATGVDYSVRSRFGDSLRILAGVSLVMLVFACVNVANMVLARGVALQHQLSTYVALGATRWAIVRPFIVEGAVVFLPAIVLAYVAATFGSWLVMRLVAESYTVPFAIDVSISLPILFYCTSLATVSFVCWGAIPVWRATGVSASRWMSCGRSPTLGARTRARRLLLVGQVALTTILLIGASLFIQAMWRLRHTPLGFSPSRIVVSQLLNAPGRKPTTEQVVAAHQSVRERLTGLPGVRSVAFSRSPLVGGGGQSVRVLPPGREDMRMSASPLFVSQGFFETLSIPRVAGRDFTTVAMHSATPEAVISESLARRLFPLNGPPDAAVGHTLVLDSNGERHELLIVGVVGSVKLGGPKGEDAHVYLNHVQWPERGEPSFVLVQTAGDPRLATTMIREALATRPGAGDFALYTRPLDELMDVRLFEERLLGWLAGTFAMVALGLTAVGLGGLLAYIVAGRSGEIGIRLALGATPEQIRRIVIREAIVLTSIGMLLAVPGAFGIERLAARVNDGAATSFMGSCVAVFLVLAATALLAAWIPASRATRLSPGIALQRG